MMYYLPTSQNRTLRFSIGIVCAFMLLLFLALYLWYPSISMFFALPIFPESIPATASLTQEEIDTKLSAQTVHRSGAVVSTSVATGVAAVSLAGCAVQLRIDASDLAAYKISIKNIGLSACQNTSYSLYYGETEKYISATPSPSASNYYWKVGTLAPGSVYESAVLIKNTNPGAPITTEGCATADNASDSCVRAGAGGSIATHLVDSSRVLRDSGVAAYVPSQEKEFGVWVWDSPLRMGSVQVDAMFASLKNNGMNAVYITIDDYLDIATLPAGVTKNNETQQYFAVLNRLIAQANALGIEVDVEGGAPDWSLPENRWKGYALIDFVKKYNQQYPAAKVRALQYDVEAYLLSTYEQNKSSSLSAYIAFIDASVTQMQGVDADFSVVVPHFYDSTQKWTPAIHYGGIMAYPFTHLLAILEKKPGSTLMIMSYRNYFDGPDGVWELTTPELRESLEYSSKIIVAQETGNVAPEYVTFFGHSKAQYLFAVDTIYNKFSGYSTFAGVATNYLDPFLELR